MHPYIAYEGIPGKTKAIADHPSCRGEEKRGVLQREKHEGGYATGFHMIMRNNRQDPNRSLGSQVSCQGVAKRMVAKFAVVRAGRNYEAGIGSYTPLMGAWHRFLPIYLLIAEKMFVYMAQGLEFFSYPFRGLAMYKCMTGDVH